jgi:hypothetical protein
MKTTASRLKVKAAKRKAAKAGLGQTTVSLQSLREQVSAREFRPLDDLDLAPARHDKLLLKRAENILSHGWSMASYKLASLVPPIDWSAHNRSFSFHLHAWEPCTLLLHAHSRFGDQRYLSVCIDFAASWIEIFGRISPAGAMKVIRRPLENQKETFAWYDMAVGQRVYRLAYIIECLLRDPKEPASRISRFWRSLMLHLKVLEEESFFKKHSNHGLYQALGQLAAAKRFSFLEQMRSWEELAERRVTELINLHFFPSGVHREHSPGYHNMLLSSLVGACQSGLIGNKHLVERINGLEEALTWMIKPDFALCTIGDTDPTPMALGREHAMRHKNSSLRWQISGGRCGSRPPPGVKCYQDAGYAFARLKPSPSRTHDNETDSYLAVAAGFHSRVHKHADHLSFVWFDGGRDILIDPARYGYEGRTEAGSELFNQGFWYSDPKRIYCESTKAHNTIEIDGKSFPRFRVRPFGSALESTELQDNRVVVTCSATHFRRIRHKRRIIMEPGRFLLVMDWLFDRTGEFHDYRQYFQFDRGWNVALHDDAIEAHHSGSYEFAARRRLPSLADKGRPERTTRLPLDVRAKTLISNSTIKPIATGQINPHLSGWMSDAPHSLVPSSTFHVHAKGIGPTSIVTLFVLGTTLNIDAKATRYNTTLTAGRIVWEDKIGRFELRIPTSGSPPQAARDSGGGCSFRDTG